MIRFGALLLAGVVLAACSSSTPAQDVEAWRAAAIEQLAPRLASYFETRVSEVVQREPWAADVSLTVDDTGKVVLADVAAPRDLSWIGEDLLGAMQEGGRITPPPPLIDRSGRPAIIFVRLRYAPKAAGT